MPEDDEEWATEEYVARMLGLPLGSGNLRHALKRCGLVNPTRSEAGNMGWAKIDAEKKMIGEGRLECPAHGKGECLVAYVVEPEGRQQMLDARQMFDNLGLKTPFHPPVFLCGDGREFPGARPFGWRSPPDVAF
jgi:hypothetical protein